MISHCERQPLTPGKVCHSKPAVNTFLFYDTVTQRSIFVEWLVDERWFWKPGCTLRVAPCFQILFMTSLRCLKAKKNLCDNSLVLPGSIPVTISSASDVSDHFVYAATFRPRFVSSNGSRNHFVDTACGVLSKASYRARHLCCRHPMVA